MLVPRFEWTAEASGKNHGRIGWRWFVWHRFSHKNRMQGASRLQLHDSKRVVRASGIFDSHRIDWQARRRPFADADRLT
jgi:hypothetical protein